MRKIAVIFTAILALYSNCASASGPKFGTNGGVGSASSTYSSGEPVGGTYAINGTTGDATVHTVTLPHTTAPSSPVDGQCWTTTAGLYCRVNGATHGPYEAGTVTSVGVGNITGITTSGAPVTSTGTVTQTLNSQTGNTVLAAPNGSSGAPTFRVLALPDLPNFQNAGTGGVTRTINNKLSDIVNTADFGTVGNGSSDDGPAIQNAFAASKILTIFPHTSNSYLLNSGTFSGGAYPSAAWAWPGNTGVYPSPGFTFMGNNQFQGTAIGDPNTCTGKFQSPYTQTCLAITDYKLIMDPASIWQGNNTTNTGLSIGCLPNHRSPNASNTVAGGYRRNWVACMYWEADTGQDGQPNGGGSGFGSSISTEVVNATLDVGSNSGILEEDNVNIYGAPTDGGITRDQFILSSCGPFNSGTYSGVSSCQASVIGGKSPWGVTSEFGTAIEIGATPFTSTSAPAAQTNGNGETVYSGSAGNYSVYPRWTNGVNVGGAVNDYSAFMNVAGESGYFFRGQNQVGTNLFTVDKTGTLFAQGALFSNSFASVVGTVQVNGNSGTFRYTHYDTSGLDRFEIGIDNASESGSNAGSNFYIARKSDAGAAIDSPLTINRASGIVTVAKGINLAGYTVATLPTCNSANKGLMVYVTDANAVTYNSVVAGGGTNTLPVMCNGTNWTEH